MSHFGVVLCSLSMAICRNLSALGTASSEVEMSCAAWRLYLVGNEFKEGAVQPRRWHCSSSSIRVEAVSDSCHLHVTKHEGFGTEGGKVLGPAS